MNQMAELRSNKGCKELLSWYAELMLKFSMVWPRKLTLTSWSGSVKQRYATAPQLLLDASQKTRCSPSAAVELTLRCV